MEIVPQTAASCRRDGRRRVPLSLKSSAAQLHCSSMSRAENSSDDGTSSRRSSDSGKAADLQSMSCWGLPVGSNGSSQSSGAESQRQHCTPRLVMRGFPTNIPSTGMPEKGPERQRLAVSAAAGWNSDANYFEAGNWPAQFNSTG